MFSFFWFLKQFILVSQLLEASVLQCIAEKFYLLKTYSKTSRVLLYLFLRVQKKFMNLIIVIYSNWLGRFLKYYLRFSGWLSHFLKLNKVISNRFKGLVI